MEYCCSSGCSPTPTNTAGCYTTRTTCQLNCPQAKSSAASCGSVYTGVTSSGKPVLVWPSNCASSASSIGTPPPRLIQCWNTLQGYLVGIMAPTACVFPNSIGISNLKQVVHFVIRYAVDPVHQCVNTMECDKTSPSGKCSPVSGKSNTGKGYTNAVFATAPQSSLPFCP